MLSPYYSVIIGYTAACRLQVINCVVQNGKMRSPEIHLQNRNWIKFRHCEIVQKVNYRNSAASLLRACETDKVRFSTAIPEPNRACLYVGVYAVTLDPLLSLYGIIYVTWYTRHLPKATGVRLR